MKSVKKVICLALAAVVCIGMFAGCGNKSGDGFDTSKEIGVISREKGSGTKKEMDLFLEQIGVTPSDLNVIARMNDLEGIKKSIVNPTLIYL